MQTKQLDETNLEQILDLPNRSHSNSIELSSLSPLQRILLTTDGTLTKILEAYLLEKIQLVKLSEQLIITTRDIPRLDIRSGKEVLWRKILLQGKNSRRNFIYAESILVLERLTQGFKQELIKSQMSLGNLMLKHRIETFKELLDAGKESSDQLATFFQIDHQDYLLSRTYCLSWSHCPVMLITEKFPESYFV